MHTIIPRNKIIVLLFILFLSSTASFGLQRDGDRILIFIVGPNKDAFLNEVKEVKPYLENHFDKVEIIETAKGQFHRLASLSNYEEVVAYVSMHGVKRTAEYDKNSYVNFDVEEKSHEARQRWIEGKLKILRGFDPTQSFFDSIIDYFEKCGHLTLMVEVCHLKLKISADYDPTNIIKLYTNPDKGDVENKKISWIVAEGNLNKKKQIVVTGKVVTQFPLLNNVLKILGDDNPVLEMDESNLSKEFEKTYERKGKQFKPGENRLIPPYISIEKSKRTQINPPTLIITRGKNKVLKIIALPQKRSDKFTIGNNEYFVGKTKDRTYDYKLIPKNGSHIPFSMKNKTIHRLNLDKVKAKCQLIIRSNHPRLVSPKPGTYQKDHNSRVQIKAFDSKLYNFDHWKGIDDPKKQKRPIIYVKMNEDKEIEPLFKKIPPTATCTLNMKIIGRGNISTDTPKNVPLGTRVSFEAEAAPGWTFIRWKGDISGNSSKKNITVNKNMTIFAVFERKLKKHDNDNKDSKDVEESEDDSYNPTDLYTIKKGTPKERQQLSSFLYYFNDGELKKINTLSDKIVDLDIDNKELEGCVFSTNIYPDENNTGNRFIAFYDPKISRNPSLIILDKINDSLDKSFMNLPVEKDYDKIEAVYPIDYQAGGNNIYAEFIVVYLFRVNEVHKHDLVIYRKLSNGEILSEMLQENALAHYYNPHEKKLTLVAPLADNRTALQFYSPEDREKSEPIPFPLVTTPGDRIKVQFSAYNYLVLYTMNRSKKTFSNTIFQIRNQKPVKLAHFPSSLLFSKYVRHHNRLLFHLLISTKPRGAGKTTLVHKELDLISDSKLMDRKLPPQAIRATDRRSLNRILLLRHINSYYLCLIDRKGKGSTMELHKLTDGFENYESEVKNFSLPDWISQPKGSLHFEAEENTILIKDQRSMQHIGVAYIKDGTLKFSPQ
jgi:hypothetical protein